MGCGASVPAGAASASAEPAAPVPTMKRALSIPVIIGDGVPTDAVNVDGTAPTPRRLISVGSAKIISARAKLPVGDQVSAAVASGGVTTVLLMMRENESDAEFQWWCCDALASLCAGNEENRAQVYVQGGLLLVLSAMRIFTWDESVQTKACWALANLAASYADHCGKLGSVEAIVAGMKACSESYQVQIAGARALQNLVAASEANRARAVTAGAAALLQETLDRNPEDGQLQWRGQELQKKLAEVSPKDLAAAGVELSRASPWAAESREEGAEQAKEVVAENLPGQFGVSADVAAAVENGGVPGVLAYMRAHAGKTEAETWSCDALATLSAGDESACEAVVKGGGLALILAAMAASVWDEELNVKAFWALLALAPGFASDIGDAGGIEAIAAAMNVNVTAHALQVSGVKLLSLLTVQPYTANLERARAAEGVRVVKAAVSSHSSDGQLQYRGVNLLERLQEGVTLTMPKQAMIRSYSMRVEEEVGNSRSAARSFVASQSQLALAASEAASRPAHVDKIALSNAAIAEVDELAEAVEETEEEAPPAKAEGEEERPEPGLAEEAALMGVAEDIALMAVADDMLAAVEDTALAAEVPGATDAQAYTS